MIVILNSKGLVVKGQHILHFADLRGVREAVYANGQGPSLGGFPRN